MRLRTLLFELEITPYIFVYGTLKPGGRNYFLAKGVTHTESAYLDSYDLMHFEPEGYPAMIPGTGRVHGVVLTFADIKSSAPGLGHARGLRPHPARVCARHCGSATVGPNRLDLSVHQSDEIGCRRNFTGRRGRLVAPVTTYVSLV